ncbi:hypothetical protein [Streptacidiphilus jiangxiensis]|uniref:Uncharacterized protein n=1 Tax=Streptacidiphilus jiangxiensis TaxID=235985 RepID=A0A1H7URG4_STRJI|nr:hypothetical protein [Streptacidiphilus jiangxiensis]SEL99359.1 hypothetical protein SAMN05414137_116112 [Streptacidiphilus jiangxiensis]
MTVHDLVTALPEPDVLRARCQALALLDVVIDGYAETYDFVPEWGGSGVQVATMDNGSGDLFRIAFDPAGVFLYGFDHECAATPWRDWPRAHWPGLLDGLPASLAHYPAEPAFRFEDFFDATVCVWREAGAPAWQCGPVTFEPGETDGADWLFELLVDGGTDAACSYVEDYYERPADRAAVSALLARAPLTRATVGALNPEADFEAVAARARALGYETVN